MNKDIIEEFYNLALTDLINGRPRHELYEAIEIYEQSEDYEACAGILKALHESEYMTIKEIKKKITDN